MSLGFWGLGFVVRVLCFGVWVLALGSEVLGFRFWGLSVVECLNEHQRGEGLQR